MTIQTDIIIIGSGIAGSSAALQASYAGLKVALLEKTATFGGSAALSAGMYWTAPTLEAYEKRIPEGDSALGAHVVEQFIPGRDVLQQTGVRVSDELIRNIMTFGEGYSFDVRGFLDMVRTEIEKAGGFCRTGSPVVKLLRDDDEAITGVIVEQDGTTTEYHADAVIIATGGFQGNTEELQRHIPAAKALVHRSNFGSTGDGLNMVRALGIRETGRMDSFYGHLLPYPLESFGPDDYLPYSQYYSESTILLNLEGRRFIDEKLGDEILTQLILQEDQARGVMIFDDWVRKNEATSEPFPGLGLLDRLEVARNAGGQVLEADTLEELYEQLASWGLDPVQVHATVSSYIDAVENRASESEGVVMSPDARAPQNGPFYAVMVQPSITFTFGGIPIDPAGHVMDNSNSPVLGLYAAGADIGGLSSLGYAGGLAPAFITGMTAGRTAISEITR